MKKSPSPEAKGSPPSAPFDGYVVCIGASAGGLDALEKFFKNCPVDSGAAFVVVQHLSPDHKSMMSNLLGRHTPMPVVFVEDDMPLAGDCVYLIPPNAILHVSKGHLHLTPKSARGLTLPIDIFFASLADAYGPRAVGVILSGTGSDGTRGATAINAAGGFLMAQEPESAKFDGMPRSVIATGLVDAILPADELPLRLEAHVRNRPYREVEPRRRPAQYATMSADEVLAIILQLLHQIGGIDFSDYKDATVMRRIERRMQVRHTPELHQYLDLLENDRVEVMTLRREMLISVTSFFRDPEAFALLAEKVIAPMVAERAAGDTIRVWVAGTATGEEAYSIGMLFIEAFERERRWPNLKIFATDVDQQCVETAGVGQYPESAAAELSPERLERFFVRKGDSFLIKNDLRQCIVFARHNLLADPPFTRIDLVSCRNTLIYFKASAQERALRALQYALSQGGTLLLGPSESLVTAVEGLQSISTKFKLFRRRGPMVPPLLDRKSGQALTTPSAVRTTAIKSKRRSSETSIAEAGVVALLDRYCPPALIVNANHEVLHLFGNVRPFLQNREGPASLELNRLLPTALNPVAAALLYKAARDRLTIVSDVLDFEPGSGERRRLRLSAHPLAVEGDARLTLLCFELLPGAGEGVVAPINVDAETMARVQVLEGELAATRESLQATIEELETSNEELQATNQELMASNEELQSSNEELQSVNEEMSTVNSEFQEKMVVLSCVNADIEGMMRAVGVATVFVDGALTITRFSPEACQIFKLRDADVGRPLDDIAHGLDYPDLHADLRLTLESTRLVEREVASADSGRRYLARIQPYVVPSTTGRGAVATFIDITALHDARRLQAIIDALPEHIAVVDTSGRIVLVNAAWRRFARANGDPELRATGPGTNYLDACRVGGRSDESIAAAAARGLRGVLEGTLPTFTLEYPCDSADTKRRFVMNVAPVADGEFGAVVSHVDVTGRLGDRTTA